MANYDATAFVLEQLAGGTSEVQIRKGLVENHGFDPHEMG